MGAAFRGMNPTPEQRNALRDMMGKGGEQFFTALKDFDGKSPFEFLISDKAVTNIDRFNTKSGELWQTLKNLGGEAIGRGLGMVYNFVDSQESLSSPAKMKAKAMQNIHALGRMFGIGNSTEANDEFNFKNADAISRIKQKDALHKRGVQYFDPQTLQPTPIGPSMEGKPMFDLQEEKEFRKGAFQLWEAQKKTDFERLNRLEKERTLKKEILGLLEEANDAENNGFPVQGMEARKEAEEKQLKLDELQRQALPHFQSPIAPDALAKANIFVGGARNDDFGVTTAIEIQREQLNTLKSIDRKLTAPAPAQNPANNFNPEFQ
jgi:hypothetical protein